MDDADHRHPAAHGLGDRDDVPELARRRDPDDRVAAARASGGYVRNAPAVIGTTTGSVAPAWRPYSVAAARLEW